MWPLTFEERLQQWHLLRTTAAKMPIEQQLHAINDWWFRAPIVNRHLQWEHYPDWPDPWDLLAKDQWCDLARGLGIMYTILMIDDSKDVSLAHCGKDNLVLVDQGKYILNWSPRELLNIDSTNIQILRQVAGVELHKNLG